MTREIKFRAWDGKQMLTEENFDFVVSDYDSIIELNEYGWTEHGVDCVEQYTGLKDKNGKEIYEGDIVKWNDCIMKVVWENDFASFELVYLDNSIEEGMFVNEYMRNWEVIGNIHENPELLK